LYYIFLLDDGSRPGQFDWCRIGPVPPGEQHQTYCPPPYGSRMPKISVEVPEELLEDLDRHVGEDGKFVNRSEAIRASIRKTLDLLDEIDERHGRIDDEE